MKERLVGTWELVSYETIGSDGRRGKPYGDAIGRINYDAAGNMSGQVMRPDRPGIEAGGYIAYFGTFELNASGDTVVHHVRGALNPTWVGGDQVRGVRFDGDALVLSTVLQHGSATVRHELTWRRIA
jgi:hypothetical protein